MKSLIQKTDEAQRLVRTLIGMQEAKRKLDVSRGKILWQLKANNLFRKAFGEGVDTWEEFLRSPEIALSTSEANRLMQLYEYFILKYELDEETLAEIPIKSLNHMLPRLKNGEIKGGDIPELVESAKTLTFNEFKERLYDVQNDENAERTYTYLVMRKCKETGNMSKVVTISSEMVITAFPNIENA